MKAQVVCKHATRLQVRGVLAEFGIKDERVRQRRNHLVIELDPADRTDGVLVACRKIAYAYLRLVEWERGGGLERTGDATCVAGVQGQPLRPIRLATAGGERSNTEHALFGSRSGLVVARARRQAGSFKVELARYAIREFRVEPPELFVAEDFSCSPREWLDKVNAERLDLDGFIPVVRSALRKVECMFCTHCHYYEVSEDQKKEEP